MILTRRWLLSMQRSEERGARRRAARRARPAMFRARAAATASTSERITSRPAPKHGTYAVNKVVRHTSQPAGRIKRLAAAVLVDEHLHPSGKEAPTGGSVAPAEEMKQIEELARAAIGLDAPRGDLLTVRELVLPGFPPKLRAADPLAEKIARC